MPRKMVMHAWDCKCQARNAPSLARCRACGAPWEEGFPVLEQEETPWRLPWGWLFLFAILLYGVVMYASGSLDMLLGLIYVGSALFGVWPVLVITLVLCYLARIAGAAERANRH